MLQLVDLKELTAAGRNDVSLEFEGTGGLLYQIVGRYYLPYPRGDGRTSRAAEHELLGIKVEYDRTNLDAEDVVGVTATVTNNRGGSAQMVIVDLGLPPGFTPVLDQLNRAGGGEADREVFGHRPADHRLPAGSDGGQAGASCNTNCWPSIR